MGLLGIDVGTSGCKATVVALDGEIKAQAYREYSLHSPRPGWYELDSEHVWECVKGVIAAAMKGYSGEPVRALSVSSFGEAVTAVSRTGKVLHNGIAKIDPRGADEVKALADRLGAWEIASVCGVTPHPMYSLGKIMWLKENMPDVYRDAYRFLPYSSYILYRLGAKPHMDYSLAARTMALDIAGKRWSPMVLDGAGVDEEKLGELVPSGLLWAKCGQTSRMSLGCRAACFWRRGGMTSRAPRLARALSTREVPLMGWAPQNVSHRFLQSQSSTSKRFHAALPACLMSFRTDTSHTRSHLLAAAY
jgi:xylulokinase